jgi:hypothetical protein
VPCLLHLIRNIKAGSRRKGDAHISALSSVDEGRIHRMAGATSKLEYDEVKAQLEASNPGIAVWVEEGIFDTSSRSCGR